MGVKKEGKGCRPKTKIKLELKREKGKEIWTFKVV